MNSAVQSVRPALSVVIPCFNEARGLAELHARLAKVLHPGFGDIEIIFVNDGSTDDTRDVIESLAQSDDRIGRIDLSRNFGKEAALSAGMDHARGDAVIFMDADLQDPPECIPAMVGAWRDGYDVVAMKRVARTADSLLRRSLASFFYSTLSSLSDVQIPVDVGDFRLLSRRALDAVKALPERNRYTKGLFAWVGFRTIELDYARPGRHTGTSKWPLLKLIKLAVDGITSFSIAPLRLASITGLAIALFSLAYGSFILLRTLLLGDSVAGFPSLFIMIAFLGGAQLMAIGLLGEYVGRLLVESKQRPIYLVDEARLPIIHTNLISRSSDAVRRHSAKA
ncbi:MAG: glycosyltransferase family 2 protein [Pseudomonadota bacterium]